jgi:hypothetical protein
MEALWEVICSLSPDQARREFARTLLAKRPSADVKAAQVEFERARALLLGMRDLELWAMLLRNDRVWAVLLDVQTPVAAALLHTAAWRARAGGGEDFRRALKEITLAPARPGPPRDWMSDFLADRVVLAYRWLTPEAPPAGDPYDATRRIAESAVYRLGEATFRSQGLAWHASRLQKAIRRGGRGFGAELAQSTPK